MFKVSIVDIEKAEPVFTEVASSLVLPGEDGEFSVMDFHQTTVSTLTEGSIKIDKREPIPIAKGVARIQGNEVVILIRQPS